ncbi:hypothetical protein P2H44_18920 [Albimonas sp. CAU 1670]|uniref:hypothetical protein n=1 Tax=Albimonas sp. CAU 1670 TaxID=3032599 RepID=UPI0023DB55E5|nr:hypothetical protein [Albimonas sp. CAU 1670]MDF2234637.1 hypothetical protein [Albimonas sp. CAU 1670]
MLIKTLGKYVLMPGAGVAMLAGFGMFDLGKGPTAPAAGPGGLTSIEDAGSGIMAALDGPLGVAKRIAMAGSSAIGMDPNQLPDFLKNAQGPTPTHQVPSGIDPTAMMGAVGGASAGGGYAQPVGHGASQQTSSGFASARPPAATQ